MANDIFTLDAIDLIRLRKFYKNAPKQFGYTVARLLNHHAVETRKEALKVIHKEMTVRNQSFVVNRMKFQLTRGNMPITQQETKTFSIKSERFSGWEEQETGKRTKRTRVATQLGRGGSNLKQIKPGFRLKPGKDFKNPDDFQGDGSAKQIAAMFHWIESEKYTKPFIIHGSKKFKSGLYKRVRSKIKRLQTFKAKNTQPKRVKFMTKARKNYFSKVNMKREWANAIDRTLKF